MLVLYFNQSIASIRDTLLSARIIILTSFDLVTVKTSYWLFTLGPRDSYAEHSYSDPGIHLEASHAVDTYISRFKALSQIPLGKGRVRVASNGLV